MSLQLWILFTHQKIKFAHQACQHQSSSLPSQGWSQYTQSGKALLCQLAGILLSDLFYYWAKHFEVVYVNKCLPG